MYASYDLFSESDFSSVNSFLLCILKCIFRAEKSTTLAALVLPPDRQTDRWCDEQCMLRCCDSRTAECYGNLVHAGDFVFLSAVLCDENEHFVVVVHRHEDLRWGNF